MLRGMSGGRRWRGRNQKQLRQLVIDVYGWRCSICHTMINPDATRLRDRLSIDHVLPVSRGGTDTIENLRPAHYGCNAARGDGSRTVRRRPTEIGIAFFPTGPGREPAPTFHFPPNRLKFGKNGETE
nr:MAG TPA: HNH endonuclease [Caudoviricetes sp.]